VTVNWLELVVGLLSGSSGCRGAAGSLGAACSASVERAGSKRWGAFVYRHATVAARSETTTAPTLIPMGRGECPRWSTTVSPAPRNPLARVATAPRHRAHSARCRRIPASSFSVARPAAIDFTWAGFRQSRGTAHYHPRALGIANILKTRPTLEGKGGIIEGDRPSWLAGVSRARAARPPRRSDLDRRQVAEMAVRLGELGAFSARRRTPGAPRPLESR
jgi:hypothetical protein